MPALYRGCRASHVCWRAGRGAARARATGLDAEELAARAGQHVGPRCAASRPSRAAAMRDARLGKPVVVAAVGSSLTAPFPALWWRSGDMAGPLLGAHVCLAARRRDGNVIVPSSAARVRSDRAASAAARRVGAGQRRPGWLAAERLHKMCRLCRRVQTWSSSSTRQLSIAHAPTWRMCCGGCLHWRARRPSS